MGSRCTVTPVVDLTIDTLIYGVSNHPRLQRRSYLDNVIVRVEVLSSIISEMKRLESHYSPHYNNNKLNKTNINSFSGHTKELQLQCNEHPGIIKGRKAGITAGTCLSGTEPWLKHLEGNFVWRQFYPVAGGHSYHEWETPRQHGLRDPILCFILRNPTNFSQ